MPYIIMISFVLLLIALFVSRRVLENGNQYLDQEQKAGLVDLFAKLRSRSPGIVIALVVIFFANLHFQIIPEGIALSMYFFILLFYMGYMAYSSYKILETNNYPQAYLKAYVISNSIRVVGLLILMFGFSQFG
jgi:hypothetical protein